VGVSARERRTSGRTKRIPGRDRSDPAFVTSTWAVFKAGMREMTRNPCSAEGAL
jgi:hypothetical protein